MKNSDKYLLILLFVSMDIGAIQCQSVKPTLNQVKLMKKFLGNWKCELEKDTMLFITNTPFGTGTISASRIVAKGLTLDSTVQLYGYDKKSDRYIMAELIRSSSVLEICYAFFTSETAGEIVVTNTGNAKFKWRFEFKTPDLIIQQALADDKVVREIYVKRWKE